LSAAWQKELKRRFYGDPPPSLSRDRRIKRTSKQIL